MDTAVKKRSVVVAGHKTSVSVEAAFWEALNELAKLEGKSLNQKVAEIDATRSGNLSSAIRLHVLEAFRKRAVIPRSTDKDP